MKESEVKHGKSYNYSKVILAGSKIKISITCIKHEINFQQLPNAHIAGRGCPVCRYEKSSLTGRKSTEDFVKQAKLIHGDKYDYTESVYSGAFVKVRIWCNNHCGFFEQTAGGHLSNGGCNQCGRKQGYIKATLTFEDFLSRAVKAHDDKYSYENVRYVYNHIPVQVTCKTHGDFPISPSNLFLGKGCPECATYGYNKSKPGSIYVMVYGDVTKVGVTNREVGVRLAEVSKSSGKGFGILFEYLSEDGCLPLSTEWALKIFLNSEYAGVEEIYDGYTESFVGVDRTELISYIKQHILNLESQNDNYRPVHESGPTTLKN